MAAASRRIQGRISPIPKPVGGSNRCPGTRGGGGHRRRIGAGPPGGSGEFPSWYNAPMPSRSCGRRECCSWTATSSGRPSIGLSRPSLSLAHWPMIRAHAACLRRLVVLGRVSNGSKRIRQPIKQLCRLSTTRSRTRSTANRVRCPGCGCWPAIPPTPGPTNSYWRSQGSITPRSSPAAQPFRQCAMPRKSWSSSGLARRVCALRAAWRWLTRSSPRWRRALSRVWRQARC